MRRLCALTVFAAVAIASPASALRGVAADSRCEDLWTHEEERGSETVNPPKYREPPLRFLIFKGSHLGQQARISYNCEDGRVFSQMIELEPTSEGEAVRLFAAAREEITKLHGPATDDADEPKLEEMNLAVEPNIPLRRFTIWALSDQFITVMLSGSGETWELVISTNY